MGEQEHWFENNNHVGNQNNMRLSGKLCDVIIKVNEKEFQAHKVILASNFKYFETMFLNSFQESKENVVTMQDVRETDLEAFITYAYTGKILITENNVLNLFELANYLTEDSIKEACVDFLKVHLRKEDAFLAYKLANSTENIVLKHAAKQVILSNFNDCSLTAEYLSLDFESLKDILACNSTDFFQSLQMFFEGIVRWILHDTKTRRPHVNDVLNQIDITKLKADYLLQYCCELIENQCDIVKDIMTFYRMKTQQILRAESLKQSLMITGKFNGKVHAQFYNLLEQKWSSLHEMASLDQKSIDRGIFFNNSFYYTISNNTGGTELDFQIFNPTSMQTTMLTSDCRLLQYAAVCADTKMLYFCGGIKRNRSTSDQILTYKPERYLFEILPPMKTQRRSAAAIFFQGCLFVVGGYGSGIMLNTVEKYDPDTKVWTTVPSMRVERSCHAVAALDGKLYACGGFNDKSVEVYDPVKNSWQLVASMNLQRCNSLLVAYEGKLLIIGGNDQSVVEVYDPNEDNWQINHEMSAGIQMNFPRGGLIPSSCINNDIWNPIQTS